MRSDERRREIADAHLQRGDGLVRVHQVGHDGLQRAVPLAGRSGTRAGVGPELAHLLVVGLLAVVKSQQAAGRRVLRGTTRTGSSVSTTAKLPKVVASDSRFTH